VGRALSWKNEYVTVILIEYVIVALAGFDHSIEYADVLRSCLVQMGNFTAARNSAGGFAWMAILSPGVLS
jgi:hypothetical protein